MPKSHRAKALYQRGEFSLYPRPGRNFEIVWYDRDRRRERSISAGTRDLEAGRIALDKHYLQVTGGEYIPPVNRVSPLVTSVIADYQLARGDQAASSDAIRHRLAQSGMDATSDTPQQFAKLLDSERAKWGDLIRKAGIQGD